MRSGKLNCSNDIYIFMLLEDTTFSVREDGTIWTTNPVNGKKQGDWRPRILVDKDGYKLLPYKGKKLQVHRIIYQAFVGQLSQDLVVNHKDTNRANNTPGNLELVTQSENLKHRFQMAGQSVNAAC